MISDTLEAINNDNNIETFSVSNLSDDKSFPESYIRKSKTVSTFLLNMPDMRADALG